MLVGGVDTRGKLVVCSTARTQTTTNHKTSKIDFPH